MSDHGNNKDAHGGGGGGDHPPEHGHKKKHHQHGHGDHPEHEEGWIVSFADNVLLMMGFFVILLAMNMGPKGTSDAASQAAEDRIADLAISIREGFHGSVDMESTRPEDQPLIRRMRQRMNKGDSNDPGPEGDKHDVQAPRPSDYVNLAGYVTFADSATDLTDEAKTTLMGVAEKIRGHTFMIEVRGHVSAQEARQDKERAMRLAFSRAYATAADLAHNGVSWDVMRVVSCADNERATPRASGDEHKNNQRVEVVITQEQKPPDPFATVETGH